MTCTRQIHGFLAVWAHPNAKSLSDLHFSLAYTTKPSHTPLSFKNVCLMSPAATCRTAIHKCTRLHDAHPVVFHKILFPTTSLSQSSSSVIFSGRWVMHFLSKFDSVVIAMVNDDDGYEMVAYTSSSMWRRMHFRLTLLRKSKRV